MKASREQLRKRMSRMWSEGVEGVESIKDIEGVEHGYLFQESRMTLAKAFWTLVARLLGDRSEAF